MFRGSSRIAALMSLSVVGCYTPDPLAPVADDDAATDTDGATSAGPTGANTMTGAGTMSTMTSSPTSGTTSPTTGAPTTDAPTTDDSSDTELDSSTGGVAFCGEPAPALAFTLSQSYDLGGIITNLQTSNIFGDGGTHIVAANRGEPRIDLLSNQRLLGMFSVAHSISVTEEIAVGVGDLNNNGVDDLAVADRGTIETYHFDGEQFTAGGAVPTAEEANWAVAIADFGGSAFAEVAVQSNGDPATVEVFLGTGTNIENTPTIFPGGRRSTAMTPAFIDGDERIDLVVARTDPDHEVDTDSFSVMLNRGDNAMVAFETTSFQTEDTPWGLGIVDLNGDGSEDIVIASQGVAPNDAVDDTIQIFFNDGEGDFTPQPPIIVADTLGQVAVGDLDCDGLDDIAVVAISGVYVLRGNGRGLEEPERVAEPDGLALGIVTGFFNNDERLDFAIGTADTGQVQLFIAD